jgi:diguanylate cyclase (GGDEF)-like protein
MNVRREHDFVARYGGEEFAILARIAERDDALAIGQALCAAVKEASIDHDQSPFGYATMSIGMAVVAAEDRMAPEELLLRTDRALYRAKGEGRNRVVMADFQPTLTSV